jgi:acyl carrier protein
MDTQEFIEKFAEALDIDAEGLSVDTEFRALDAYDSLAYLSVIAMLDEDYDTLIEQTTFKSLQTIGDIINYIEDNK